MYIFLRLSIRFEVSAGELKLWNRFAFSVFVFVAPLSTMCQERTRDCRRRISVLPLITTMLGSCRVCERTNERLSWRRSDGVGHGGRVEGVKESLRSSAPSVRISSSSLSFRTSSQPSRASQSIVSHANLPLLRARLVSAKSHISHSLIPKQ